MNQLALFADSRFLSWLDENRHIYSAFVRISLRAKRRGFMHWSARAVVHVLRFETPIRQRGEPEFKINNNYSAGLARLAMHEYPELKGFFRIRDAFGFDLSQALQSTAAPSTAPPSAPKPSSEKHSIFTERSIAEQS